MIIKNSVKFLIFNSETFVQILDIFRNVFKENLGFRTYTYRMYSEPKKSNGVSWLYEIDLYDFTVVDLIFSTMDDNNCKRIDLGFNIFEVV